MGQSRREFLTAAPAGLWAAATIAGSSNTKNDPRAGGGFKGSVCFFSKHLPDTTWRELARRVKRMGFEGVDLTVRTGGHVVPEKGAEDLPRAVAAIRDEGLEVPMITTELVSATHSTASPILSAAGKHGIPFFKPGYYKYSFVDVRKELEQAGSDFRGLAELGTRHGLQAGFHNHAAYVGAPVWDVAPIIESMDPRWVGYYFDIRHAMAEGGGGAWKIATHLVSRRLKMIAVKDFYWEKSPKGWGERNCALGEGMVDWKYFFSVLASSGFHGPVSLHLEYDIPGNTAAARQENTMIAAQRDLEFLKARIAEAYS